MQVSLLTLFSIFISLTVLQYFVGVYVSNKLSLNKHKVITGFQLVITLFCVWVSVSSDKATMQLGTGMLIASYLIYLPYSLKKSGST